MRTILTSLSSALKAVTPSYLLLLILLSSSLLYSQFDNRQVLFNQARRMEARRDYDSAQEIYEDLLKRHPHDEEIAEAYLNLLFLRDEFDEAEKMLNQYEKAFRPEKLVQHKILIAGKKGRMDEAKRLGLQYLRDNPGIIHLYQEMANTYERIAQFETALEVLQLCRRQTGDEYIFAIDMARNFHTINKYPEAVAEYIKHLERNSGFLYMVTDRIKSILSNDQSVLPVLERLLSGSENPVLLELYALTLTHINEYDKAYDVYAKLGPERLIIFADELTAAANYTLAVKAYEEYFATVSDPIKRAEVKVKIASIQITGRNYNEAEQTLLALVADQSIQDRQIRFRSHVNRNIREMLADLYLRMNKPLAEIMEWLENAKSFAFNQNEQREIDLKKVRYLIMLEDYEEAKSTINRTIGAEHSGTRIYNISFFYRYLLDLMVTNNPSDSLLAELIINIPGEELTNEAIFLAVVTKELNPQNKKAFLQAYRLKNLYREEEALTTLLASISADITDELQPDKLSLSLPDSLFSSLLQKDEPFSFDEEIALIAAQWAYDAGRYQLAETLYSFEYEKDALAGYAAMKLSQLQKALAKPHRKTVTSFLRDNPQNILAPQLRLLLIN